MWQSGITEVQGQEVGRSGRMWRWWKRGDGAGVGERGLTSVGGRRLTHHELLSIETGDGEAPVVQVSGRAAARNVLVSPEAGSVYFRDFFDIVTEQEEPNLSSLNAAVKQLLSIEGATGAAIVDYGRGMALAQGGSPDFDLGVAAAGHSNVVSSKLRTMAELGLEEEIEDILITLGSQYHLINILNTEGSRGLFVYLVLDRSYANLALARHKLSIIATAITI